MCDPVLIVAILGELGFFDEERDKKAEVDNERSNKSNSKHSGEGEPK